MATTENINSFEEVKKQLFGAARTGQLELLQETLAKVENDDERRWLLKSVVRSSETLLHTAACYGQTNVAEWLLSEQGGRAAGFDKVLAKTSDGFFALYVAAQNGHLEACKAIVNGCRVENGERDDMLNVANDDGWTVLHCAVNRSRPDIVKWLLSSEEGGGRALGFHNVLAKARGGVTALHYAGNLETLLAVVDGCRTDNGERREMLNSVDGYGCTILHRAASGSYPEIISWLLSDEGGAAAGFDRSNVTALSMTGSSVLHFASRSHTENIQAVLSHCNQQERMNLFLAADNKGWSALCYAARNNRPDCITELFQHPECKMIANRKDDSGMTVLHRAIIGGLDENSLLEWNYGFKPNPAVITALLGSSETGWTSIDPNIGLGLE